MTHHPPPPKSQKYKMLKLVLGSETYKQLQSSIDARMQLAQEVTSGIREAFVPGKPCPESWKKLFISESFDRAPGLGQGQYGSARMVRLKSNPTLDLAIKKTKKMESEEVMNTILAGTLPEVGANPHFNIFYMHLHCEEMDTPLYRANQHRLIPWKDAESQIRTLMQQMAQDPSQTQRLQMKINAIEDVAYPTLDDIHRFHEFKLQQESEFANQYGNVDEDVLALSSLSLTPSLQPLNSKVPAAISKSLKQIRATYHAMQKVRSKYHEPHEYILMELAEPGSAFKTWIQQGPPVPQLISAAFQVCMASLSLMAFFQLTQNDLLLNNITFNPINPDVYYVYKIGSVYFKVPLYGKIVKIFDFGLTTNTETFYKPTRPGHVPTHWCVGGRGSGKEDQLQCSVYVRDMLELFFRLSDEYGRPDDGKFQPRHSKLMGWIAYAHEKIKAVTEDSIASACKVILDIFHSATMKRFGLPVVIDVTQTSPPLSSYQSHPFEVVNRKKYIQQIHTVIGEKVWDI